MRKQKVIIDFSKLGDSELDQKAAQIIEALTNPPGSVNFPTPAPTIVIVGSVPSSVSGVLNK